MSHSFLNIVLFILNKCSSNVVIYIKYMYKKCILHFENQIEKSVSNKKINCRYKQNSFISHQSDRHHILICVVYVCENPVKYIIYLPKLDLSLYYTDFGCRWTLTVLELNVTSRCHQYKARPACTSVQFDF